MSDIEQAVADSLRACEFNCWPGGNIGDCDHEKNVPRLLAALAERGYHVTRSDREARLEAALREALEGARMSADAKAYGDPVESYKAGWNDAMDHAARVADSLVASALLSEAPE